MEKGEGMMTDDALTTVIDGRLVNIKARPKEWDVAESQRQAKMREAWQAWATEEAETKIKSQCAHSWQLLSSFQAPDYPHHPTEAIFYCRHCLSFTKREVTIDT